MSYAHRTDPLQYRVQSRERDPETGRYKPWDTRAYFVLPTAAFDYVHKLRALDVPETQYRVIRGTQPVSMGTSAGAYWAHK